MSSKNIKQPPRHMDFDLDVNVTLIARENTKVVNRKGEFDDILNVFELDNGKILHLVSRKQVVLAIEVGDQARIAADLVCERDDGIRVIRNAWVKEIIKKHEAA